MKYIFLAALCTTTALYNMNDKLVQAYKYYDKDNKELKKLLNDGIDPNKSSLILHTILNGDLSMFTLCINAGYNPFNPNLQKCFTVGIPEQYRTLGFIARIRLKITTLLMKKIINNAQTEYAIFLENPKTFKSSVKNRDTSAYLKMIYIQSMQHNNADIKTFLINAQRLKQNATLLTLIEKSKFNTLLNDTEKQILSKSSIEWTTEGFGLKNVPMEEKMRHIFSDINIIYRNNGL